MRILFGISFILLLVSCGPSLPSGSASSFNAPSETLNTFIWDQDANNLKISIKIERPTDKQSESLSADEKIVVNDETIDKASAIGSDGRYEVVVPNFTPDKKIEIEQTLNGSLKNITTSRVVSLPDIYFQSITLDPEPQNQNDLEAIFNFTTREQNPSEVCVQTSVAGKPDSTFSYSFSHFFTIDLSNNNQTFLKSADFNSEWSEENSVFRKEL